MPITFDSAVTLASCAVALLAVCVSAWAVWESKQTQLNAAYFSEMTAAYSSFLGGVSQFVLRQDEPSKNTLASDLYRLKLFASDQIMENAQKLYTSLLEWRSQEHHDSFPLDPEIHLLAEQMRTHLELFRVRKAPR